MPALHISPLQSSSMSTDLVMRHSKSLGRRADLKMAGLEPEQATADLPLSAPRLKALHAVLRSELPAKAGAAAAYVGVDLDHCARQLFLACKAGAVFREPAAAALMCAAAALGARWIGDERLYSRGLEADDGFQREDGRREPTDPVFEALPDPVDPGGLKTWAETSWAGRYRLASARDRGMRVQTRYALTHAVANQFSPQALRTIADAVFRPDETEGLTRFLAAERSMLAATGLDHHRLGDRRIERLCVGADLVFGLGRFVRLAQTAAARGQPAANGAPGSDKPDVEQLNTHLHEALNALAEQPR